MIQDVNGKVSKAATTRNIKRVDTIKTSLQETLAMEKKLQN